MHGCGAYYCLALLSETQPFSVIRFVLTGIKKCGELSGRNDEHIVREITITLIFSGVSPELRISRLKLMWLQERLPAAVPRQ
jgi:hypothetical protein